MKFQRSPRGVFRRNARGTRNAPTDIPIYEVFQSVSVSFNLKISVGISEWSEVGDGTKELVNTPPESPAIDTTVSLSPGELGALAAMLFHNAWRPDWWGLHGMEAGDNPGVLRQPMFTANEAVGGHPLHQSIRMFQFGSGADHFCSGVPEYQFGSFSVPVPVAPDPIREAQTRVVGFYGGDCVYERSYGIPLLLPPFTENLPSLRANNSTKPTTLTISVFTDSEFVAGSVSPTQVSLSAIPWIYQAGYGNNNPTTGSQASYLHEFRFEMSYIGSDEGLTEEGVSHLLSIASPGSLSLAVYDENGDLLSTKSADFSVSRGFLRATFSGIGSPVHYVGLLKGEGEGGVLLSVLELDDPITDAVFALDYVWNLGQLVG